MRKQPTPAERRLWYAIRKRSVRFKRQFVIGPYIVDLYCPAANLVIEVDGSFHDYRSAYDARRTLYLNGCGLRVIRFQNSRVFSDLWGVVSDIDQLTGQT